ncbi:hypothetical protein [Granulicella rosea]|nr:hypothetical protein [Granulicella rosea]
MRTRVLVMTVIAAFFMVPAVEIVYAAFKVGCDCNLYVRGFALVIAAVLLILPGRIAYVIARRRVRTGEWALRPTQEERVELVAKWTEPTSGSLKLLKNTDRWDVYLDLIITFNGVLSLWNDLHSPWSLFNGLGFAFWSVVLYFYGRSLYRRAASRLGRLAI